MKLWTPNYKTVDPLPICNRCGGIDRRALLARFPDGRRFYPPWVGHAGCCCVVTCTVQIRFVVAGVDATLCTDCGVLGAFKKMRDLSVDGTYTSSATLIGAATPITFTSVGSMFIDTYNSEGCADGIDTTDEVDFVIGGTFACNAGTGVVETVAVEVRLITLGWMHKQISPFPSETLPHTFTNEFGADVGCISSPTSTLATGGTMAISVV